MRKIKFRGIKYDKTGWMYGSLLEDVILDGIEEINEEYISISKWYSVIIPTIGQYIGKKDKNGVEIYEGDIVVYKDFYLEKQFEFTNIGEVRCDDETSSFYFSKRYSVEMEGIDYNDVLVVGNIHDHLLKEESLDND